MPETTEAPARSEDERDPGLVQRIGSRRLLAAITVVVLAAIVAGVIVWVGQGDEEDPGQTVPQSIAADCSRPVDREINAYLAQVPDGSTVVFAKNGCYAQDDSLQVNDRAALTIDGNGSTFKAVTEGHPCRANWRVQGGTNITLKNMTVRGVNTTGFDGPRLPAPAAQCQHGYSFDSVQGGSLLDSKAFDTFADPVSIEPDIRKGDFCAVPPNRNILVDRFHGFNAGRTVAITHADGVTIQNSYFGDIYDNAIDIETDVPCESSSNVRILNNRFGRYRFAMIAHTGVDPPEQASHIEIRGNVAEAAPVTCFPAVYAETHSYEAGRFRQDYTIVDNHFRTLGHGIYLNGIADSRVEGNRLTKNYGTGCLANAHLVHIANSTRINVYGNQAVESKPGEFAGELLAENSSEITQNPPR